MTKASILALAIAAAGLPAAVHAEPEGGRPLMAHLTGPAEKPTAGDPDGAGHASLRVNLGQSQVCYEVMTDKIAAATMAHVHKAPPAEAGPPVITLATPGADGKSKGCADVEAALAKDLLQNPGGYYVNVHTADFPAGAIRGQLSK